jgi:hypothetical protein
MVMEENYLDFSIAETVYSILYVEIYGLRITCTDRNLSVNFKQFYDLNFKSHSWQISDLSTLPL